MDIKVYSPANLPSADEIEKLTSFLFNHLDEYGDPREDIGKAIDYALQKRNSPGGDILIGYEGDDVAGAVILNKTGMDGYIPENILVYIAVDGAHRGKGFGKQLMAKAIDTVDGGIALHVEPDNPAVHLYKKMGFTNKYLEMRYTGN